MRLDRIYTKSGDSGSTFLADGEIVSKSSQRIAAYGTVDELNSFVGMLSDEVRLDNSIVGSVQILGSLILIQNELFDLGGELATKNQDLAAKRQNLVSDKEVQRLEKQMDDWTATLPPLVNFVLPGGCRPNSIAHVCRTVCRRAEREMILLTAEDPIRNDCIKYINRLSDWFFVLSRVLSSAMGASEELWNQKR